MTGGGKVHTAFWWGNVRERENLEEMVIDGRIILKFSSKNRMGAGMCRLCGRGGVYTAFWWGNVREREHLEGMAVEGRIILKCTFQIWKGRAY